MPGGLTLPFDAPQRFWKTEQEIERSFSMHSIENDFEIARSFFCSVFQNLRLGSMLLYKFMPPKRRFWKELQMMKLRVRGPFQWCEYSFGTGRFIVQTTLLLLQQPHQIACTASHRFV